MPKSGGRPDSLQCLKETSEKADHQARLHNKRHRPKEIVALAAL